MRLLVKHSDKLGLATHIPDADGHPLCQLVLQSAAWELREIDETRPTVRICVLCQRHQSLTERGRLASKIGH